MKKIKNMSDCFLIKIKQKKVTSNLGLITFFQLECKNNYFTNILLCTYGIFGVK